MKKILLTILSLLVCTSVLAKIEFDGIKSWKAGKGNDIDITWNKAVAELEPDEKVLYVVADLELFGSNIYVCTENLEHSFAYRTESFGYYVRACIVPRFYDQNNCSFEAIDLSNCEINTKVLYLKSSY